MKYNAFPILLATTFLSTPAVAQTVPEINADYLNNLTSDKVSLQKVEAAGENTIEIDGNYYQYTYNTPEGYYESKDRSTNKTIKNPDKDGIYEYIGLGVKNTSDNYGDVENRAFINNNANIHIEYSGGGSKNLHVHGGVISNQGGIDDILADFVGNSIEATASGTGTASTDADGGAIYNSETIGKIIGEFIGNYANAGSSTGGAICNGTSHCGGGYAVTSSSTKLIENSIGDIIGDFIGNYVVGNRLTEYDGSANGGAIANYAAEFYSGATLSSIGNITGDFIGNYARGSWASGGAIYNKADSYATAKFGNINGNFVGNYTNGNGGAIYNYAGYTATASFGNITGNFIGNYANIGGAIYNSHNNFSKATSSIGDITGDFIGNHANYSGGAIYNLASADAVITIGNITGNFIGNYVSGTSSVTGGAISNSTMNQWTGIIGDITGDFVDNYVTSSSQAYGGAIYNMSEIGSIKSQNISGNKAISTDDSAMGGFLYGNELSNVKNISGNIYNNLAQGKSAEGGAIYSSSYSDIIKIEATVDNDPNYVIGPVYLTLFAGYTKTQSFNDVKFDSNKAIATEGNSVGGAIVFDSSIGLGNNVSSDEIRADDGNIYGPDGNILTLEEFVKMYTDLLKQQLGGFATYEEALAAVGGVDQKSFEITNATFTNNVSQADNGIAMGGAIANAVDGVLTNSSFANNKAIGKAALGGAIYNSGDLTIVADNYQSVFSGNMANDKDNDIYNSSSSTLLLSAVNGGEIIFNDGIDGDKGYKLTVEGDGEVIVNSTIENVGELNINGGNLTISSAKSNQERRVVLSSISNKTASYSFNKINMVGGNLNLANLVIDEIKTSGFYSDNGTLHIDVDPVKMTSDKLSVDGNVEGTTKLVVHTASNDDLNGKIVFAESVNDSTGNEKSFEISRVYKSPYMYEVKHQSSSENGNEWYFESDAEENPDYHPLGPIKVAPEVIGFEAVTSAGLSQTNGMVYNIMRKVGVNRLFCPGCGFYDYNWDGEAFHNVWVDTTYNGLTIEAPVKIEAKVWGIEAGSDLQHDLNNKLGIFASYRQGNYEMDGKGEKYYSTIGSEIDIDSYLAGLYYRYDHNNWYAFATVYGGMQEAEIKTDDGVSADTDGIEFGGSVEGGYNYALSRTLSVTPSLGVFYSQINYDDATDSAGKTVEYNDLKQVELEAGAKFAYTQYTDDGFYSLYIKPSVVQTLVDGDEIDVTELGKVDTVEDKTLGRVEIGGNYGFNDNWSAYGWANYTFGSDYEATSLGIGINYAW